MFARNGPGPAIGRICVAWLLVAGSAASLKAQAATGSAPTAEATIPLRQVAFRVPVADHGFATDSDMTPAIVAEDRMRRRSRQAVLRIAAAAGDDEPSLLRYSLYGAGIGAAGGAGVGVWAVATADVLMLPPWIIVAYPTAAGAIVGSLGGLYAYGLATYEEEDDGGR